MSSRPIVLAHAYKHGLSKEDILHAWKNAYVSRDRVDGWPFEKIAIGPDCNGRDVQFSMAWSDRRGTWVIFHAMYATKGVRNGF